MKTSLFTIRDILQTFLFGKRCQGCGQTRTSLCEACFKKIPEAEPSEHPGTYGIYAYSSPIVHSALWDLKYHHRASCARALAYRGVDVVRDIIFDTTHADHAFCVVFVPIPQHKTKTHTRGYNQSALIAKWWSEQFPESRVAHLIEKYRATLPQSHIKNKAERLRNIAGVFRLALDVEVDPHVLYIIVDDVTTTGATFLEARNILRTAGAHNILCIALAHGYKNRKTESDMVE